MSGSQRGELSASERRLLQIVAAGKLNPPIQILLSVVDEWMCRGFCCNTQFSSCVLYMCYNCVLTVCR